ncbi:hypothetical protein ACIBJI_02505 [Nocardia sp. NPDC050408]|uniref:hypothetical protein n=1 Tax=Nocardia sp. NPDC050408 TaxID=3364319 RepID=UPI0037A2B9CD
MALAVGGLTVACTGSTSHAGPAEDAPKPTIVLVHGAFADGSSWNDVIDKLRRDRYPVVAAANPLGGPASDAAALRGLISHINGPVTVASAPATPTGGLGLDINPRGPGETPLMASTARGRGIDSAPTDVINTDDHTPWGAY